MSVVNESKFHMWRTVFAMAHADDVVTSEEIRFMVEALEDVPFSEAQRHTLTDDIAEPQDIEKMFSKIEDPNDQAIFFDLARKLVWVDGDYGYEERKIMLKLKELHVRATNVDDLIGKVSLEFEDDNARPAAGADKKEVFYSFRDNFLRSLNRKD